MYTIYAHICRLQMLEPEFDPQYPCEKQKNGVIHL